MATAARVAFALAFVGFALVFAASLPRRVASDEPAVRAVPRGGGPAVLRWEVVSVRPHDPDAFTQGLQFAADGRLYEGTGLYGESTLREVDPATGAVLRLVRLPPTVFGEGITLVNDRIVQISWMEGTAFVFDRETFAELGRFEYQGEGWGLCYDGAALWMSTGSDRLLRRDPASFAILGEISVTRGNEPLALLNELECAGRHVWANALGSTTVYRIDPHRGIVDAELDLSALRSRYDVGPAADVLNGIAVDPATGHLWVTGKRWNKLFELRIVAP